MTCPTHTTPSFAYVSCLCHYIHMSRAITALSEGYWIAPLLVLGFQMLSGSCKTLWAGLFETCILLFLSWEGLFADNHSSDFVHGKITEGERHVSPPLATSLYSTNTAVASIWFKGKTKSAKEVDTM